MGRVSVSKLQQIPDFPTLPSRMVWSIVAKGAFVSDHVSFSGRAQHFVCIKCSINKDWLTDSMKNSNIPASVRALKCSHKTENSDIEFFFDRIQTSVVLYQRVPQRKQGSTCSQTKMVTSATCLFKCFFTCGYLEDRNPWVLFLSKTRQYPNTTDNWLWHTFTSDYY